jgi:hypothetical protein
VNDTIYGQMSDYARFDYHVILDKWHLRGTQVKVKLINGDYFPHGYISVDFGGLRGWENTFQNTIPLGGDGALFTFGRVHWEMNMQSPVVVPAAVPGSSTSTVPALAQNRMTMASQAPVSDPTAVDSDDIKKFRQQELDPDALTWPKSMPKADLPASTNTDVLGEHTVYTTFNYEPSRRLRIYQFDPLHHAQAIWSIH